MSLDAWALAATQSLVHSIEDKDDPSKPAQIVMIAEAVTRAAREQRGWPHSKQRLVAIELAIVENETHASMRLHRNECLPKECDAARDKGAPVFRAISLFQLHAGGLSDPKIWPTLGFMTFESTLLAAKEASRIFVRSYLYCQAQKAEGDPVALGLTAYAGRGCQLDKWQGWRVRLSTYERLMRVPVPRDATAAESQKPAG